LEAKRKVELEQIKQEMSDIKFDKNKHAGTVFDPTTGQRVPVATESQLPKPKSNAEIILELQQQQKAQSLLFQE